MNRLIGVVVRGFPIARLAAATYCSSHNPCRVSYFKLKDFVPKILIDVGGKLQIAKHVYF